MSTFFTAAFVVFFVVSILLFAALLFVFVGIYNSLVALNVNIDRAVSNIEVLAKQRFDEIPQLVAICKGYMAHERETLQKVVEARNVFASSNSPSDKVKADFALGKALDSLYAVSENYPDLKANGEFLHLQRRVSDIESDIADRREFYNASVSLFNSRIKQIPDILVAKILNYNEKEMFKAQNPGELESVKIDLQG